LKILFAQNQTGFSRVKRALIIISVSKMFHTFRYLVDLTIEIKSIKRFACIHSFFIVKLVFVNSTYSIALVTRSLTLRHKYAFLLMAILVKVRYSLDNSIYWKEIIIYSIP
jgi:hypothetical protein